MIQGFFAKKLRMLQNVSKFLVFIELLSFLDLYYLRTDTKFFLVSPTKKVKKSYNKYAFFK